MKKLIEEFKKFIMRGNVLDLAVGVVMGNAFSKIVSSLVNDIMMPFIGVIIITDCISSFQFDPSLPIWNMDFFWINYHEKFISDP